MSLACKSLCIQRSVLSRGPALVKPGHSKHFCLKAAIAQRVKATSGDHGVTHSADELGRIEALGQEAYERAGDVIINSGLTFPPEAPAANDSRSYSTSFRVTDTQPTAATGLSDVAADISAGDPADDGNSGGFGGGGQEDAAPPPPAVGGRYGITVMALNVGEAGQPLDGGRQDVNAKIDNLEAELAVLREVTGGAGGGGGAGPSQGVLPGQPDPALQSVEDLRRSGTSAVEQIVAQGAVMGDFAGQPSLAKQSVEDAAPAGLSVTERVVAEGAVMDDPLNNPLDHPNGQPMSGYMSL
ncbi:hypothetical protein HYH02_003684 [Chlamydomonas schloesseri]|uniref:Uncharacterized protein n=1 Tax=Chlamydomonas schloesseri TaxID=2026947 RepID=A0A835WR51_9CHLO|nr:hypothetical protein HYH02_003684 [Chlamydomonas schloesseri]|eukprot:KAG2451909.1 hypothetical protein HYH02_003684 [Chlamydomonas schloesseri]